MQQRRRQDDERNALRKDVVALRIMQANYEQIVKAQHSVPGHNEQRLSDQDKFQVVSIFLLGISCQPLSCSLRYTEQKPCLL